MTNHCATLHRYRTYTVLYVRFVVFILVQGLVSVLVVEETVPFIYRTENVVCLHRVATLAADCLIQLAPALWSKVCPWKSVFTVLPESLLWKALLFSFPDTPPPKVKGNDFKLPDIEKCHLSHRYTKQVITFKMKTLIAALMGCIMD